MGADNEDKLRFTRRDFKMHGERDGYLKKRTFVEALMNIEMIGKLMFIAR